MELPLDRVGETYLSSMVRSVVLQSNPSVLCPAALPSLLELGASPAARAVKMHMNKRRSQRG